MFGKRHFYIGMFVGISMVVRGNNTLHVSRKYNLCMSNTPTHKYTLLQLQQLRYIQIHIVKNFKFNIGNPERWVNLRQFLCGFCKTNLLNS